MDNLVIRERMTMQQEGSVTLAIRAHPDAKRTAIKGVLDDGSIKIDLAAPADDGKANAELITFLAKEFSVPKQNIEIVTGHTGRRKIVRITS